MCKIIDYDFNFYREIVPVNFSGFLFDVEPFGEIIIQLTHMEINKYCGKMSKELVNKMKVEKIKWALSHSCNLVFLWKISIKPKGCAKNSAILLYTECKICHELKMSKHWENTHHIDISSRFAGNFNMK